MCAWACSLHIPRTASTASALQGAAACRLPTQFSCLYCLGVLLLRELQGGGGIYVGLEGFQPSAECGADTAVSYASAKLTQVSFSGNVASDRGGAVHVAAGSLEMDVSSSRVPLLCLLLCLLHLLGLPGCVQLCLLGLPRWPLSLSCMAALSAIILSPTRRRLSLPPPLPLPCAACRLWRWLATPPWEPATTTAWAAPSPWMSAAWTAAASAPPSPPSCAC